MRYALGVLTGIILTRCYDRSPRARAWVHWAWTMDQRHARRWHL